MTTTVVETWDVLAVTVNALLHLTVGPSNAFPFVMLIYCLASLNRDLDVHEAAAAVYMLRHACGAVRIAAGSSYAAATCTVGLALWSRSPAYLGYHHIVRRGCVLLGIGISMLVLHGDGDGGIISVLRFALFVGATRYDTNVAELDPWDACAHSMWLLAVPAVLMALLIFHPRKPPQHEHMDAWYPESAV